MEYVSGVQRAVLEECGCNNTHFLDRILYDSGALLLCVMDLE